ncbi:conserved hypothetical protein [Crenothrix polyspora]|jgi:hypothetical protein|uniref:Type II toxin-antitoxin system Phd/YefM family antitoxin n=1 Tax=Crenothrix polyspora TaxID=360316 RepID=A0A1R4H3X1_9GAMM|nr:hypothetical protein [Crenothrix polyspora]SJM90924.1 conserved hypothetical protein [Crenothrix polyspora]
MNKPQYITDAAGHKISVILPMDEYLELLEDLEDLAAVAERKDETTTSFDAALKEIGYDVLD